MTYDPMDTARWMLAGLKSSLGEEKTLRPDGTAKKKTKTQRSEELLRFETLCELVWNVEGRPGELAGYTERMLAA